MMDLITLGSPIEIDAHSITTAGSPSIDEHSSHVLELPAPERLLHIGIGNEPLTKADLENMSEEQQSSIMEKVKEVFEGWTKDGNSRLN